MKKFVLTIIFVMMVFAFGFFSADLKTVIAEETKLKEQTFFLTKPQSKYISAFPYYIIEGECNEKGEAGKSFIFEYDEKTLNVILTKLNARKITTEKLDGINVDCYFSDVLINNDYIVIDGKRINLQIAINNNTIIVGSPIILGSF